MFRTSRLGRAWSVVRLLVSERVLTFRDFAQNIPASSHRWKTLQVFLNAQLQLIAIERAVREQRSLENGGSEFRQSALVHPTGDPGPRARAAQMQADTSTERIVDQRERNIRDRRSASNKISQDGPRPPQLSTYSPAENEYASGDQPWLGAQSRRFSSPAVKGFPHLPSNSQPAPPPLRPSYGVRSSTSDLRSNQAAMEAGHDPRRASLWSKFRQSASQSVLSLAPSGSMMEMHLGLSMDKHLAMVNVPYGNLPSESDPALGRHMETERRRMLPDRQVDREGEEEMGTNEPKKKKGLKGFFNKLISGGEKKSREAARSAPTTPRETSSRQQRSYYDDTSSRLDAEEYPLAPPPPLSALANEPRYHQRSVSNSSVDSFPQPLSLPQLHPRSSSTPVYNPGSASSSPPHPLTPTFPQDFPTARRGSGFGISGDRASVISGRSGRYDLGKVNNARGPSMDSYSRDIETSTSTSSPPRYPPSLLRSSSPEVLETWTEVSDVSIGGAGRRRSNASIRNSRGPSNLVRKEKSLPQLPSDAVPLDLSSIPSLPIPTHSFYPNRSTPSSPATFASSRNSFYAHHSGSAYSIRSPSRSNGASPRLASRQRAGDWGEDEEIVGGSARENHKAKSRRSIFALPFALGLGGKKHRSSTQEPENALYASRGISEDSRRLRTSEDPASGSRGGSRSLVY